jgi:hypothetical protein
MAYGSEGSKNARFKDFLNIYILKIYIYIYVGLMFFHFKDHF